MMCFESFTQKRSEMNTLRKVYTLRSGPNPSLLSILGLFDGGWGYHPSAGHESTNATHSRRTIHNRQPYPFTITATGERLPAGKFEPKCQSRIECPVSFRKTSSRFGSTVRK